MSAHLWHQSVTAQRVQPPEVLSGAQVAAMASADRSRYLRARRRWLRSLQHFPAQCRSAMDDLTDLVEANLYGPPGAKDIVAVTAPFAVGKSTLVRAWAQEQYRQIIGGRLAGALPTWNSSPGVVADEIPIVWIDLAAASKIKSFNTQLLRFYGYPVSGAIHDLTARIPKAVDAHRTRLLIIDDTNLLNLRHKDARDVLDHLKHVNTILGQRGASMVLVGAELEDGPIFRDPQIEGRLQHIRLDPLSIDTPEQITAWQHFLHEIEGRVLPYLPAARPGLLAGTHAPRIWRRTQGYLGDVARLVADAAHLAALDDSWTIKVSHLEQVTLSKRATQAQPPSTKGATAKVAPAVRAGHAA